MGIINLILEIISGFFGWQKAREENADTRFLRDKISEIDNKIKETKNEIDDCYSDGRADVVNKLLLELESLQREYKDLSDRLSKSK